MALVDSLLSAIVRADGDALVMHVGERPYVVVGTQTINISTHGLNLEAMTGMLTQLLPDEAHSQLEEFGAVEHRIPQPGEERFSVVAARGGDDIWIEIRRRRPQPVPPAEVVLALVPDAPTALAQPAPPPSIDTPVEAAPIVATEPIPEPVVAPEPEPILEVIPQPTAAEPMPPLMAEVRPEPEVASVAPVPDAITQLLAETMPPGETPEVAVAATPEFELAAPPQPEPVTEAPTQIPAMAASTGDARTISALEQLLATAPATIESVETLEAIVPVAPVVPVAVSEPPAAETVQPHLIVVQPIVEEPQIIEPVAAQPIVEEPPIVEPVAVQPIVEEPPIVEPVAAQPIVEEPPIAEPAAVQPIVEEPPIAEPVAVQPIVEEPPIVEPVAAQPNVEEPPIAEPVAVQPIVEEPPIAEPVAVQPIVEEPPIVEPVAVQPIVEEPPIVEPVAVQPIVEEPPIVEPVAVQPIVEEPPIAEPVAVQPIVEEPQIAEPVAVQPIVEEPPIAEPVAVQPIVEEPPIVEPVAVQPIVEEPQIVEPVAAQLIVEEPPIVELVASQPTVEEPPIAEPVAVQPIVEEPPIAEPVAVQPIVEEPQIVEPVAVQPIVEEPQVAEPVLAETVEEPTPEADVVQPLTRTVRIEVPEHPQTVAHATTGIDRLMRIAAARGASALFLTSDSCPRMRVEGDLRHLDSEPSWSRADVESAIREIAPESNQESIDRGEATEWISEFEGVGRIRCTTFVDHHGPGVLLRIVATHAATVEQLRLEREVRALATEPQGIVLVAGLRASGKSTLISALVELVTRQRAEYVITLERQIRLVHDPKAALVSQREVHGGADESLVAARAALRESPDVLVLDDLVSAPLVPLLMTAAADGLLIFVSITAPSTADAVKRFIELAPSEMRRSVQNAMAESFRGAVAQVLLKKAGGGVVAAREVLLATSPVAGYIGEGQFGQLPLAFESGRKHGMVSFSETLADFVRGGTVDVREAFRKAPDRNRLLETLKRSGVDTTAVERLV